MLSLGKFEISVELINWVKLFVNFSVYNDSDWIFEVVGITLLKDDFDVALLVSDIFDICSVIEVLNASLIKVLLISDI